MLPSALAPSGYLVMFGQFLCIQVDEIREELEILNLLDVPIFTPS